MTIKSLYDREAKDQEFRDAFKRSNFKSFHAYSAYNRYGTKPEAIFWEWMANPITKYDKDGNVVRRKNKEGKIYQWLSTPFSKKINDSIFVGLCIVCAVLTTVWVLSLI